MNHRTAASFLLVSLLVFGTGCPQFQRVVMKFDVAAGQGVFTYHGLTSDGSGDVGTDFRKLIEDYLKGTDLEKENPLWTGVRKQLTEKDGALTGTVSIKFADPAAARIYKHDKKSPYIFCGGAESEILATNGTDISKTLPGCVAWDRKMKVLELTLAGPGNEAGAASESMLDFYTAWKKDGTLPPAVDAEAGLDSALEALGEGLATPPGSPGPAPGAETTEPAATPAEKAP